MPKRDPDIILARFNRNPSVKGKYVGVGAEIGTGEKIILSFYGDENNFTHLTEEHIVGARNGEKFKIHYPKANLSYSMIDGRNNLLEDKSLVEQANGILIGNKVAIFLPKDAIFPFMNILNYLS